MRPPVARRAAAAALALALAGCSSFSAPHWLWPFGGGEPVRDEARAPAPVAPAPAPRPVAPADEAVLSFQDRADAFYQRLAQRRFNTLATYNDATLRAYFQTQEGYSDYYARLAEDLVQAHFEKNRPLAAELLEFSMETPDRARVRFRLEGKSSLPFRFWSVSIEREDVWERSGGKWWIVPGKL